MQIKYLRVCNINLCELYREWGNIKNYLKIMKCKSDYELEILEKLLKKKQISLNSYFGCHLSFKKAKNDSKTKKNILFYAKIIKI